MAKALFFDVFGTLVDWRAGVARESAAVLGPLGHQCDWLAFADAWRGQYQGAMERVRAGARGYVKLDTLHAENLALVLPDFGITDLDEAIVSRLARQAWRRLDAWPGIVEGLRRLRRKALLAPVSNGNISLMVDMARHNDFAWDAILGAEIARDYKPSPTVYRAACAAFDLPVAECAMVAAHSGDLRAAAAEGLLTVHLARPNEYGSGRGEARPECPVDFAVRDLQELDTLLSQ